MSNFLTAPIAKAKSLLHLGAPQAASTEAVSSAVGGGSSSSSSGGDSFIWLGIIAALAVAVWFSLKHGGKKSPAKGNW